MLLDLHLRSLAWGWGKRNICLGTSLRLYSTFNAMLTRLRQSETTIKADLLMLTLSRDFLSPGYRIRNANHPLQEGALESSSIDQLLSSSLPGPFLGLRCKWRILLLRPAEPEPVNRSYPFLSKPQRFSGGVRLT
ncbi:hypothetical protein ACRALDRAFT_2056639 [Sodiomyces alcalophilus JCM 7366]|uniref:uncharacterized protein n=1 Tax=Sodiomyces alcalophilus JCM 7366 TaxID=591952 RepID=UPI0039B59827